MQGAYKELNVKYTQLSIDTGVMLSLWRCNNCPGLVDSTQQLRDNWFCNIVRSHLTEIIVSRLGHLRGFSCNKKPWMFYTVQRTVLNHICTSSYSSMKAIRKSILSTYTRIDEYTYIYQIQVRPSGSLYVEHWSLSPRLRGNKMVLDSIEATVYVLRSSNGSNRQQSNCICLIYMQYRIDMIWFVSTTRREFYSNTT